MPENEAATGYVGGVFCWLDFSLLRFFLFKPALNTLVNQGLP
jgi:hypothetical protein